MAQVNAENSWWSRATKQQKLDQIVGAIECKLTASFVAKNCGTTKVNVYGFAKYYNLTFVRDYEFEKFINKKNMRNKSKFLRAKSSKEITEDHYTIFDAPDDDTDKTDKDAPDFKALKFE